MRARYRNEVLTIRLPEEVKQEFEQKTRELELSMAQVARKLIEDWIKAKHKQKKFDLEIPI